MRRPPPISTFTRYPITAGTCLLAVGLTLAWWNKMPVEQFMMDGGIRKGEIWRLITGTLLHGDTLHLLFNVYWTWVFGTLLEEHLGQVKTLGLILLFGVTSSAAEYAILRGGVGLSGVGYGLFGLTWILHTRDERFADGVDKGTVQLFVLWFFICIVLTYTGAMAVANIAHGVGCVIGVATGFAMTSAGVRRAVISAAIAVFTMAGIATSVWLRPYVNLSGDSSYECQLADAALTTDRYAEAEKWLGQAIQIEPNNPWSWYNLGVARQRLGERDAILAFRRATELDPGDPRYRDAYRQMTGEPTESPGFLNVLRAIVGGPSTRSTTQPRR